MALQKDVQKELKIQKQKNKRLNKTRNPNAEPPRTSGEELKQNLAPYRRWC
jgi:hypothetical protein